MGDLTAHFSRSELRCRHCGEMRITCDGLEHLETLRCQVGLTLHPSSGYRCRVHDADVHRIWVPEYDLEERDGPHTIIRYGNCTVDVEIMGWQARKLVCSAISLGWTGIGLHQKGDHDQRIVHLDRLRDSPGRPRPWIWSY